MPKIFYKFEVANDGAEKHFYIPRHVKKILIQGSAIGGNGGSGDGTRTGGGGGAGDYIDGFYDVMPGSRVVLQIDNTFGHRFFIIDPVTGLQTVNLFQNGKTGSNATGVLPGNGGESGCGCLGGTGAVAYTDGLFPEGVIDSNNLLHTTGGWGGTNTSTTRFAGYAFESGRVNKRRLKYVTGNLPDRIRAIGGASYWGAPRGFLAGSTLGYGVGGYGDLDASSQPGGPGFFSIIWDDL